LRCVFETKNKEFIMAVNAVIDCVSHQGYIKASVIMPACERLIHLLVVRSYANFAGD
jgi:hypothetical protein